MIKKLSLKLRRYLKETKKEKKKEILVSQLPLKNLCALRLIVISPKPEDKFHFLMLSSMYRHDCQPKRIKKISGNMKLNLSFIIFILKAEIRAAAETKKNHHILWKRFSASESLYHINDRFIHGDIIHTRLSSTEILLLRKQNEDSKSEANNNNTNNNNSIERFICF